MKDKTQKFDHPLTEAAESSSKTGWIITAILMLTVVGIGFWLMFSNE